MLQSRCGIAPNIPWCDSIGTCKCLLAMLLRMVGAAAVPLVPPEQPQHARAAASSELTPPKASQFHWHRALNNNRMWGNANANANSNANATMRRHLTFASHRLPATIAPARYRRTMSVCTAVHPWLYAGGQYVPQSPHTAGTQHAVDGSAEVERYT